MQVKVLVLIKKERHKAIEQLAWRVSAWSSK
jgi:hypothetical protein